MKECRRFRSLEKNELKTYRGIAHDGLMRKSKGQLQSSTCSRIISLSCLSWRMECSSNDPGCRLSQHFVLLNLNVCVCVWIQIRRVGHSMWFVQYTIESKKVFGWERQDDERESERQRQSSGTGTCSKKGDKIIRCDEWFNTCEECEVCDALFLYFS